MKLLQYQKAEMAYVAASTEESLLVGSKSPAFEVNAMGQELAPSVDFGDDAFNLEWD